MRTKSGTVNGKEPAAVCLRALAGVPEIRRGDDLADVIAAAARREDFQFANNDVLVVAQKIVSKAEGATARLGRVKPGAAAREIAAKLRKDPRLVQIILDQARRIVRRGPNVLIAETHHGLVCANAGVDFSNVPGRGIVTLLPKDPDKSARRLASGLRKRTGKRIAVIISDTFGRAWRLGQTNVAIGAAGIEVMRDLRGGRDRLGKPLHATILAVADDIAAAAGLLMEKTAGTPAVVVRGPSFRALSDCAARLIRPAKEDLFR